MTEPVANRAARRAAEHRSRRARALGAVLVSGTAALGTTAAIVGGAAPAGATTITVLNLDDAGVGSLRQALADADDGDVIEFAPGLTGTLLLDTTLDVLDGVTIRGPGADLIAVDGQGSQRIFEVDPANPGQTVTVSGLTLQHGSVSGDGAAIRFTDSNADDADALVLTDLVLDDNHALDSGAQGGAVFAYYLSSVTFRRVTFSDNSAYYYGGAAAIGSSPTIIISDSSFTGNESEEEDGGALYITNAANVSITGTTFRDNRSADDGGGAVVGLDSAGGATSMVVADSVFDGNATAGGRGDRGGGLYVDMYSAGSLTITNTTFQGNSATDGGGLTVDSPGTVFVGGTTFSGNSAGQFGGGIQIDTSSDLGDAGTLSIANSTISGNTAGTAGAGVIVTYYRGEESDDQTTPPIDVLQSTVTANTAPDGAGITMADRAVLLTGATATDTGDRRKNRGDRVGSATLPSITVSPITLVGSIVSANPGGDVDTPGPLTGRHALVGTVTGSPLTDLGGTITSGDPGLDPLADNGGPTRTHALKPTSAAVGAGPDPVPDFPGNTTDQRGAGFPRVAGGRVDIGAYELEVSEPRFTG